MDECVAATGVLGEMLGDVLDDMICVALFGSERWFNSDTVKLAILSGWR